MAVTRIYAVYDAGTILALVRTTNKARALQHALGNRFEAVLADQDLLLKYGGSMTVENDETVIPKTEPAAPTITAPGATATATSGGE